MISKNKLKYVRQLEQKKYRKREGLFVAEGVKVVNDLLLRYKPKMLFATHEYLETHPLHNATFETIEVSPDELTRLSFQQHPQQVLALFPIPTINYNLSSINNNLSLALDGVQDPGNLGTIIRIADWFGIENIYCSEDTVDAWNPKVVLATMGSISRVNLIYIDLPQMLDNLQSDFPVYGTFLDGKNIYDESLSQEGLVIMGNEGNGISDAVRSRVNRRLLIPDFHQGETADSLNVAIATAITCSEFRRRK